MAKVSKAQPTSEQLQAINTWAARHGRTWKQELRDAWYSGDYGSFRNDDVSGYLQQVRNQFGPSWLNSFKLEDQRIGYQTPYQFVTERY